jgi:hypothetical protein
MYAAFLILENFNYSSIRHKIYAARPSTAQKYASFKVNIKAFYKVCATFHQLPPLIIKKLTQYYFMKEAIFVTTE